MREYAGRAEFSLQAGPKIFQQSPFDKCNTVALA